MTFENFYKSKSIELTAVQVRFAKHILEFEDIDFIMKAATGKTFLFNLMEEYFSIERENVKCNKIANPFISKEYLRSHGYIPIC